MWSVLYYELRSAHVRRFSLKSIIKYENIIYEIHNLILMEVLLGLIGLIAQNLTQAMDIATTVSGHSTLAQSYRVTSS